MINVEMQEKGETVRVFHISVTPDEVEQQFNSVTKNIQSNAALPGFRKGKVPLDLVTKKYGLEIREAALDRLVNDSFRHALEQTKSVPIEKPRFENLVLDRDKPLTYQMTVEVLPKVKLGSYQGLKLKKKKEEVSDAKVAEVLERLRQQNALLVPVEGRPSQTGDVVAVDFQGQKDGKPVAGAKGQGYVVELGSGQTIPEFEQNLSNLNVEESKTFPATFPADYHSPEMAGQTVEFTVTLKSIREKKLADLDDEFAKEAGQFENLDALKARVRQDLENEEERRSSILLREQVVQQLGKIVQVKIPETLVNRSLDKLMQDQEKHLREQNKTWEQSGTTADAFRQQQREAVEFQWRSNLALREIALAENIEVVQDDLNAEVERLARMSRQTPQAIHEYLNQSKGWDEMSDRLLNDKTLFWVISKAKIAE